MRGEVHIERAKDIRRTRQIALLVPGEVAEVEQPELPVRDREADRARVLGRVGVTRREVAAERVGGAAGVSRTPHQLAARRDDADVEAGNGDGISRLHLQMTAGLARLEVAVE
jgi:hypothetical protein